jgi:hypothetical protein
MISRTRYQKAGITAINAKLRASSNEEVLSLWTLSCVADAAAKAIGKKKDLYPSLFDYEQLLPPGAKLEWIKQGESSSIYCVINPYYQGKRRAERARNPDFD